jgi:4-amino-4-deoxy-L-arabinose transferase-like glycosyltransferase
VPFALVVRPALRIVGVDPESPRGEVALSYFLSAGAVALPAALAAVCLFFLGLRLGGGSSGAAFGALVMSLGAPMWAYASLFWAHALVGACFVFAFASALKVRESKDARGDFLWALAVGLAAGWATVTEYPAAPASAILALLTLSQA